VKIGCRGGVEVANLPSELTLVDRPRNANASGVAIAKAAA
jgi:hypothetical protein